MKSIKLVGIIMSVIGSTLASCKAQPTLEGTPNTSGNEVLIVYLTRTKNTQAVAQMIQKEVGGKLVGLELVNPYPENYRAHVAQMVRENAENFLPPLKTRVDSIDKYDIVFIGFPTWDMKIPPPMKTFLKQYNLSGKTVVPFNTNAGYGVGSGFETVKDLCKNCKVLEGYSTTGGIERDGVLFVMEGNKEKQVHSEVRTWLNKFKLLSVNK